MSYSLLLGIEIIHSVVHNHFQPDFSEGFCSGKGHETFHRIELDTFDDLRQRAGHLLSRLVQTFLPGGVNLIISSFFLREKMHAIHLEPGDCMP